MKKIIREILNIKLIPWTKLSSEKKIIEPNHTIKKSYLIFRKVEDDEIQNQLNKLNLNIKN